MKHYMILTKVGHILTRKNGKYQKATSIFRNTNEEIEQEVVGVIRKLKREIPSDENSTITHINIAFGGHIEFQKIDGSEPFLLDITQQAISLNQLP